ncbi:MAG: hypothetical protein LC775_05585 [Acidobacteria bacterium]|nr:hypothetical protein [Acidobacteriota bacterium]
MAPFKSGGGADAAGKPGNDVAVEIVKTDLRPLVQFIGEVDALFVVGEVAAVERKRSPGVRRFGAGFGHDDTLPDPGQRSSRHAAGGHSSPTDHS